MVLMLLAMMMAMVTMLMAMRTILFSTRAYSGWSGKPKRFRAAFPLPLYWAVRLSSCAR